MKNIWNTLKPGFTILAPMEDVTDTVFRQIVASCGAPDLFFTEFTNAEGMFSYGSKKVHQRLKYTEQERPLIAQIWGKSPDAYYEGAKVLARLGFDGIDINMGCPVRKIVKQGCCSALIKNRDLASEIISATQKGAGELPVSVKTRIGFDKVETESWAEFLLGHNIQALTIHPRLAVDMSKGQADWGEVGKVVNLRDDIAPECKIVGNGDIMSLDEVDKVVSKYNVDGVMIGRGIFQNPWVFNRNVRIEEVQKEVKIELLKKHLNLYHSTWGNAKDFNKLKKFIKIYINGYNGSATLRAELMSTSKYEELIELVENI